MTRMTTLAGLAVIVIAGAFAACSKASEPAPSAEPGTGTSPGGSGTPAPVNTASPLAEISWDAPPAWQSVPNASPMRKATYKIPRTGGDAEDAEMTVSAAAGGVEANVKRWAGQFGDAKPTMEKKKVNGLDVTVVEIKGTFSSGGMMGAPSTPKEKQMLLGAIVDAGDRQHFFKLTGPEKTVAAARPDFDKLVASFRSK
jgi:hypothetical protein